jgi:hypothetical protein
MIDYSCLFWGVVNLSFSIIMQLFLFCYGFKKIAKRTSKNFKNVNNYVYVEHNVTLSKLTKNAIITSVVTLNAVVLSIAFYCSYAQCQYAEHCYTESSGIFPANL